MFPDFDKIILKKNDLEKKINESNWEDPEESIQLTKEHRSLTILIDKKKQYDSIVDSLLDNEKLLSESKDDPDMVEMIQDDIDSLGKDKTVLEKEIIQRLLPADQHDGRPVIVEIRAGTGGEEASLFASELAKMYQRFIESKSLHYELLELSQADLGGIKEISFCVKGDDAWKLFKYEAGTHRVQRVPVTESSGRIHTSAVTVAVLPEPSEVEISINPKDLRIDTYRSSGPGGQSVNTMDSAIRITHNPSGIVVTCQDEKSQLKNKEKAMRILKARLLDQQQREENQKRASERKNQVGSGDRSEKIRTYNFPQNRVTDHRINLTLYNLEDILAGNIEELPLACAEYEYKKIIESQE